VIIKILKGRLNENYNLNFKMNKTKLTLISLGMLLLPVLALAQPAVGSLNLCMLIGKIETAVWEVFGLIAVIAFVTAGILFLTAGGSAEKVAAARSAAIWGVAGVIVGIIAFSIIAIVGSGIGVGVGSGCQ